MATRRIRISSALAAIASLAAVSLFVIPVFAETNPTLTTDKADYAPGEVVHISGTNLPPGEYAIPVKRPSGDIVVVDPVTHEAAPGWEHATADASGNLTYDYQLNGDLGGYEARAYPAPWSGDWNETPVATVTFTDASNADLDQCRNGTVASPQPCTAAAAAGSGWVNGNATSTQAHFLEGDSQAYRMKLTDLDIGTWKLRITYDTTESGRHGIDYLTSFDRTETTANPCDSLSFTVTGGCNPNTPQSTFAIPPDQRVVNGPDGLPTGSDNITQAAGNFEMFGSATITAVSTPALTSGTYTNGTGYVGTTQTSVDVTFTVGADDTNLVLAWGGHISKRQEWSPEVTASDINGSNYHMRNGGLSFNNGAFQGGNQDRQLSAGGVISPATVTIVKQATPEGSTPFPFTSSHDGGFSLVDDGTSANTTTFTYTSASQFIDRTYTENTPAGWDLTGITCVEAGQNPDNDSTDSGSTATADVDEGEDITCTFTNQEQTSITIEKDTVPNALQDFAYTTGGSGLSNFSLDDDTGVGGSSNTLLNTKTFTNPATGDKYIRETPAVPGYTITDIACTGDTTGVIYGRGGTTSGSFTNGPTAGFESGDDTVKVPLDAGDQVSCKFTNSKNPEIKVVKDLVPNADAGRFDLKIDSTTFDNGGAGFADGNTGFQQVSVGQHTVSEVAHSGTSLSDYFSKVECDSSKGSNDPGTSHTFSVAAGDQVTCTITNQRKPEIKVVKDLVPNADGGRFDLKIDSTTFDNGGAGFADGDTGFQQVSIGSHTVSEVAHTGTSLSDYFSKVECDSSKGSSDPGTSHTFSVAAGDKVTCTVTNQRKPEIKVVKDLVPNADGGRFDLKIDSNTFDNSGNGFADGDTGFQQVSIGSHSVSEVAHSGTSLSDYFSKVECDSSKGSSDPGTSHTFSVAAGDKVTCTITNQRKPEIKVVKDLVPNADGGRFDLKIDSSTFDNGGAGFADGDTGFQQVSIGSHTVSEVAHSGTSLSDYVSKVECDSSKGSSDPGTSHTFSVAAGDKVTCTITNQRKPEIKVVKDLVPNADGGRFDLKIDSSTFDNSGNGFADGDTGFQQVTAGSHTVSEVAHSGTSLSDYVSKVECDSSKGSSDPGTSHMFSVAAGDKVTCTITNQRKPEIKVVKDLVPNADGGRFDLKIDSTTFDNSGNGFADGDTGFQQVSIGSHTVSEVAHSGTNLSDYVSKVECDSSKGSSDPGTSHTFSVAAGDQVTCTITNQRKPEIKVVKDLVPNADGGRFDLKIDSTTFDNGGAGFADGDTGFQQVTAGSHTVSEVAHSGTSLSDYVSKVECDSSKGSSDPGTSHTFSVAAGDKVTCTITNQRKPEIKVVKDLVPNADGGRFDLKIDSTTFDNGGAGFADGDTGFQQVTAGSHTVSEVAHSGTSLGDYFSKVECDSSKGSSDPGTSHTFSLAAGDKVTCTITNQRKPEIKVVKDLVPNADGGRFDLKIDSTTFDNSGNGFADGDTGFQQVSIGSHTVSEVAHSGSSLSDYFSKVECDSSKGSSDPGTSHTFSVAAGDKVTCTVTNQRKPEIKVVKDLAPNADGGRFDLKIDATTFDNGGAGFADGDTGFQQVSIGSHTVSEVAHTGTSLSDYFSKVECDSSKGSSDPGTSHTFSVAAGDQVTCTVTNQRKPEIKVVKDLVPNADGGRFDLKIDSTTFDNGGAGFADGDTGFQQVTAGSHTVSEVAHSGTSLGDYFSKVECDSSKGANDPGTSHTFSVAAGDKVTCTITNERKPEIKVVKDLVPNADGGRFDLKIDSTTFDNGGAGFADGDTGFQQVSIGSHTVSEVAHSGTSLSDYFSKVECDSSKGSSDPGTSHTFSVAAGDKVTCTITNQRKPEIKVVKDLVPNADGGRFDLKIDSTTFDNSGNGFADGDTGFQQVSIGSHTVSEIAHSGTSLGDYVSKVECDSSKGSSDPGTSHTFSVAAGDKVTCTITNERKAEIKVVKDLVPNDDGGRFDLKIDSTTFDNGGAGFADGDTGFQQVSFGSHTVSEVAHSGTSLSDYFSKVECDSSKGSSDPGTSHTFSVAAGDKVTCTITNERKPEIKVVKDLVPNADGGRFDLKIDSTTFDNGGAGFADGDTGFQQVSIGSHTVSEVAHSGTSLSDYFSKVECDSSKGSNDPGTSHTFSVAAGDQVTCTITNERKPEIKVVKDLVPNADGGRFDLKIDSTTFDNGGAGFADGDTGFQQVSIGQHTVSEVAHAGTSLGDYVSKVECDSSKGSNNPGTSHTFSVAAGDKVTCTITNEKEGKLTIKKNALPDDPQDFAYTTSGSGLSDFTLDDDGDNGNGFSNQRLFETTSFGDKYVTETGGVTGWTLADISCTGDATGVVIGRGGSANFQDGGSAGFEEGDDTVKVPLDSGDDVTCTFRNEAHASITIEKDALPNALDDFPYATGGLSPANFSLDDDAGVQGGDNTLQNTHAFTGLTTFGDRYVRETPSVHDITDITCTGDTSGVVYGRGGTTAGTFTTGPSNGFELGDDAVKIPLDPGDDVHCKFVNNRHTGTLRVIKNVVNDNGGTLGPDAFSMHVKQNGAEVANSPQPGSASGTVYTLPTGTYSVSEDAPPSGYQQVGFSGDCDSSGTVTVVKGQERTCTITNDDIAQPPPDEVEVLGVQKKKADTRRPNVGVGGVSDQCVSRDFIATVRIADASRIRAVTVKLDGRVIKRAKGKLVKVRVRANRLRKGRHRLTITARDAAGNRRRVSRTFRRCAPPALPNFTG